MAPYPKRPSHFAHSFCRLLFKACAAQRVGTDGVALLTLIVHTEDAAHYRRPVDYFNVQLAPMLGLSEPALRRTRDRCVKAGWLSYENGGKYQPGTYYVTVPETAKGIDDSASDERAEADKPKGVKRGADGEPTANRRASEHQSAVEPTANRRRTDVEPALSNPVPVPVPVPEEDCSEPPEASQEPSPIPAAFPIFRCTGKPDARRWTLTDELIAELCDAFPGVAVRGECRKAWQWIEANPSKRKTAKGMPDFLFRWMTREQDRNRSQTPLPRGRPSAGEHNRGEAEEALEILRSMRRGSDGEDESNTGGVGGRETSGSTRATFRIEANSHGQAGYG